jgi:hypothetical protein
MYVKEDGRCQEWTETFGDASPRDPRKAYLISLAPSPSLEKELPREALRVA